MRLCATAKGLTAETCFACGNITYGCFIIELIKTAYDEKCYEIFKRSMICGTNFTDADETYWNEHCNDDLDVWTFHSDCDGKFIPQECRKIYNVIKNLKMDIQGHNYGVMKPYNMLDHWKFIFKHCADKRVNLYYT